MEWPQIIMIVLFTLSTIFNLKEAKTIYSLIGSLLGSGTILWLLLAGGYFS